MSTKAKGVYAINSDWSSGNLVFYEKAYGLTTTGNILKIGTTAVQVGDIAQVVDFSWYATGSLSVILSASDSSLTMVGINLATNAPVVITDATPSTTTGTGALIVSGGVGIALGLFVGEVVSVGTVCQPDANGGAALGTTLLQWSNLFLYTGGVINFNNGDVTLTHASNSLAFAGGAYTLAGMVAATSGENNYTGTGIYGAAQLGIGVKGTPISIDAAGANAGMQIHVQQDLLLDGASDILSGLYITSSHGNVTSTNGAVEGLSVYARNSGTGTCVNLTGGLCMVYSGAGNSTKYKKGLLVDVLDQATTHPSGGGTQGLTIQLNPTSITNNQVDAILINQNSALQIASGIVFKGLIGNTSGNHAVINFVGSGDIAADGNKGNLFKFRSGSATYVVTPAQFLTALGANCTAI